MLGRDRLDLIELLSQIAETGRLSAAARASGLSQPSVSRLLRQLEELVDTRLVQRSTHALTLTSAGLRFLAAARPLVAGWDHALEEVRAEREQLVGHLSIVAPVAAGQHLLASVAARFIRLNPGVTINWTLRDDAVDPTQDGADLWIRAGTMPTEALVVRELWHIERAIVAAPNHPAADHPGRLADDGAVRITTFVPEAVELTHRDGERFVLHQSAAFLADNLYAARAALLEGVGYGILPLWAVQADLRSGALIRLCPEWRPPVVVLSLAYPPNRHRPQRLVVLLAYIKSELTRAGGLGIDFIDTTDAGNTIRNAPGSLTEEQS